MGEFFAEILLAIGEMVLYVLLELVQELFFDLVSRGAAGASKRESPNSPVLTFLTTALLGLMAGGISILVWPRPLFHPSRVHESVC